MLPSWKMNRWVVFAAWLSCVMPTEMGEAARADEPQSRITHGFLATGGSTYIRDGDGKIRWRYPKTTRDGWILPDHNVLLTLTKSKDLPGGGVVELTPKGEVVFEYKGTQSEV